LSSTRVPRVALLVPPAGLIAQMLTPCVPKDSALDACGASEKVS
jgi:hypothetical protein